MVRIYTAPSCASCRKVKAVVLEPSIKNVSDFCNCLVKFHFVYLAYLLYSYYTTFLLLCQVLKIKKFFLFCFRLI